MIAAPVSFPRATAIAACVLAAWGPWAAHAQQATPNPAPVTATAKTDEAPLGDYEMAARLSGEGRFDEDIAKVSEVIEREPANLKAYILRGDLYAKKKQWDQAGQDFLAAQKINPQNSLAKFDLAEIQLMQKQFDAARPGFDALVKDPEMGDLAAYKVFLCDLYGGHQEAAAKELQAFDVAGANASYYYSHAAWALYNKETAEGRRWIRSALYIYTAQKNHNYSSTLQELGYLPLPPE